MTLHLRARERFWLSSMFLKCLNYHAAHSFPFSCYQFPLLTFDWLYVNVSCLVILYATVRFSLSCSHLCYMCQFLHKDSPCPFEYSSLSLYLWSCTLLLHIQSVWGTLHTAICLWLLSSYQFSSKSQVLSISYLSKVYDTFYYFIVHFYYVTPCCCNYVPVGCL